MMEQTTILGAVIHHNSNLVQEIKEVRGVVEQLNEFHEYYLNPPVLITIPDGKTPRQRRREQERKNKVRYKRKPLC